MNVLLTPAAKTSLARMPSVICAQKARDLCVHSLEAPNELTGEVRIIPGVSGRLSDSAEVPLYWRRLVEDAEAEEDAFAPIQPGEDASDSPSNWVAIYRSPTLNECINLQLRPADALLVLDIVENRNFVHELMRQLSP